MKPAQFEYFRPASLGEACSLLAAYGEDAKLIAGGQSLVPLMNFRLARPKFLVDINGLASLDYLDDQGERVAIGALTRERSIERSALVADQIPILSEATRWIGHPPIRTRGTIGGSLAHNDPSAEYPLVATLLGADVSAHGSDGTRRIPIEELFVTYLTTSLAPDEILTEIRFPKPPPGAGWGFQEMVRRRGDFAIVAAAAILALDGNTVTDARIAIGGAGPVAFRATSSETILKGEPFSTKLAGEAAARAASMAEPDDDVHASAAYRRHLVEVLTRRVLVEAKDRASATAPPGRLAELSRR